MSTRIPRQVDLYSTTTGYKQVSGTYQISVNDRRIGVIGYPTTLYLPPWTAYTSKGQLLSIIDEAGNAAGTPIVLVPNGSDTVNGISGAFALNLDSAAGTLYPTGTAGKFCVSALSYTPFIPFQSLEINGKAVGNTLIGATYNAAGKNYKPHNITFEITAATGVVGVGPTLSLGTNSPNYDNIVSAAVLGITQANKMLVQPIADSIVSAVAPNTPIYLRVSVGATLFTAYTFNAFLYGHY